MDELAQLKMVSGLTSSDLTERIAYGALTEGPLAQASEGAARAAGGSARARRPAT